MHVTSAFITLTWVELHLLHVNVGPELYASGYMPKQGNTDRNASVMAIHCGKYYTHFHTFAEEVLGGLFFSLFLSICLFIIVNRGNLFTIKSSTKEVLKFCENPIKLWVE